MCCSELTSPAVEQPGHLVMCVHAELLLFLPRRLRRTHYCVEEGATVHLTLWLLSGSECALAMSADSFDCHHWGVCVYICMRVYVNMMCVSVCVCHTEVTSQGSC